MKLRGIDPDLLEARCVLFMSLFDWNDYIYKK
jgi:hypothetical protein